METIVAVSTAPGIGGIGIIRMSGNKTFEIINKIFQTKNIKNNTNQIKYGHIINLINKEVIDEVLVSFFKAPKSYTTEDVCEINSHGGNVIINKILEICLENGAKLAEPGEFTKRAFLNGRIDLTQAESVIDIINSKTEKEAKEMVKQLKGELSYKIKEIKQEILDVLSTIEAAIDYPEYDIEEITKNQTKNMLHSVECKLEDLKNTFDNGKIIKEGIKIAIIGRPNVGKSSLLNLLVKEDRAIVSQYEGTTRDTIEEFITINGIPIKIIDTAGIRETENEIEKIGIKKAVDVSEQADLIVAIFDISEELTEEDKKILEIIENKKSIIIMNKMDLGNKIDEKVFGNKKTIKMSILKRDGMKALEDEVTNLFQLDEIKFESSTIVTNARHKDLIRKAIEVTREGIASIDNGMPIDVVAIHIKEIIENLNKITGESVSEDIIKEIFSKFCLGK